MMMMMRGGGGRRKRHGSLETTCMTPAFSYSLPVDFTFCNALRSASNNATNSTRELSFIRDENRDLVI
jgi:hypothetical protein